MLSDEDGPALASALLPSEPCAADLASLGFGTSPEADLDDDPEEPLLPGGDWLLSCHGGQNMSQLCFTLRNRCAGMRWMSTLMRSIMRDITIGLGVNEWIRSSRVWPVPVDVDPGVVSFLREGVVFTSTCCGTGIGGAGKAGARCW